VSSLKKERTIKKRSKLCTVISRQKIPYETTPIHIESGNAVNLTVWIQCKYSAATPRTRLIVPRNKRISKQNPDISAAFGYDFIFFIQRFDHLGRLLIFVQANGSLDRFAQN